MKASLFLAVLSLLHLYLGRRIVDLTTPLPLRVRRILGWGIAGLSFVLLTGSQMLYRAQHLPPETAGMQYLAFFAYFLAGFLATLLVVLLPLDSMRLVLFVVANLVSSVGRWVGRSIEFKLTLPRKIWFRISPFARWAFLGFAFFACVSGLYSAVRGPQLKYVTIARPGLHADLEGFRIVQITDIHVGPTILRADVQRIVERVNSQNPDLIVFTGDLADGFVDQLATHVAPLSGLRAPRGVYAVTGNHEYYWGAVEWVQFMKRLGMTVLNNEHVILPVGAAHLLVGGVPDSEVARFAAGETSDPVLSVAGAPAADFKVLLAHRPSSCFEALRAGYDFQVSGHTHGGQFIPWSFLVPLANPYTRGLNLHEGSLWVYVSAGTEYWGPPNRFGVAPEITVFTLSRKK